MSVEYEELSTRERRHLRTHQAILDAARRIISEKGIDGLSMRAIARKIEYSPAGLYEYFGSKDEIVAAVCAEGNERLTSYMKRVDPTLSLHDYLMGIGAAYIEFAVRNPDHFTLMFNTPNSLVTESPISDTRSADIMEKMADEDSSFGVLLRAIQRGIDEGVFQTAPGYGTLEMAHTAWSLVHGMATLRIGTLRDLPLDFAAMETEGLERIGLAFMQETPAG